jgi:hypothetical protein
MTMTRKGSLLRLFQHTTVPGAKQTACQKYTTQQSSINLFSRIDKMASYSDTMRETENRLKSLKVKLLDRKLSGIFFQIYVQVVSQKVFNSHVYAPCNILRIQYTRRKKRYIKTVKKDGNFEYRIVSTMKYEKDFMVGFKFWINEMDAKKYLTFI